jgi:hypothetical protein
MGQGKRRQSLTLQCWECRSLAPPGHRALSGSLQQWMVRGSAFPPDAVLRLPSDQEAERLIRQRMQCD